MTQREHLIESISRNSYFEYCQTIDDDACDMNCKKCAERQLTKYEQKIRAEAIEEFMYELRKYKRFPFAKIDPWGFIEEKYNELKEQK